jgi:hypothetical protein
MEKPATSRFGPASYLAVLAIVALLQLAAIFGFSATRYFGTHGYPYDAFADQRFSVAGIDADVLLVGDSALFSGVDPAIVKSDTGLTAYNLGVTMYAYANAPEFLLDRYLARNKPPRIIVFYINPKTHFDDPEQRIYEAASMILRHGSLADIGDFFFRTPSRLIDYAHQALTVALTSDWSDKKYWTVFKAAGANAGFYALDDTPEAANFGQITDYATFCAAKDRNRPPEADEIEHFRQKYTQPGTSVLIYVAPLADCDKSAAYYAAQFEGLADNSLHTLPHDLFLPDLWRTHLKRQGGELNSHLVGEWLQDWALSHGVIDFGKPDGDRDK